MKTLPLKVIVPLSFFIFIIFIIFLADTADHNFAFRLIGDIPYGDKFCHALLYGVMALALNYGLNFRGVRFLTHRLNPFSQNGALGNAPYTFHLQLGSIIVLIFATIEECTQYYIPSRTFDLGDLLADLVGVVLFSFIRSKK